MYSYQLAPQVLLELVRLESHPSNHPLIAFEHLSLYIHYTKAMRRWDYNVNIEGLTNHFAPENIFAGHWETVYCMENIKKR